MKMEDIHPGILVRWDEQVGVLVFVEISETSFKLLSLHDFEEKTFTSNSLLSNEDFRLMRPATIEEARAYINRVTEELKGGVQKKKDELGESEKKLDAYFEEAKRFLKKREAESVPQEA